MFRLEFQLYLATLERALQRFGHDWYPEGRAQIFAVARFVPSATLFLCEVENEKNESCLRWGVPSRTLTVSK